MLAYLGTERSGITVSNAIAKAFSVLPTNLRYTLTWGEGAEMSEHASFTSATNVNVYFSDAASPWQRGTHENTNRLLRQYYPKGTDPSNTPLIIVNTSPTSSTSDRKNHLTGTPVLNA